LWLCLDFVIFFTDIMIMLSDGSVRTVFRVQEDIVGQRDSAHRPFVAHAALTAGHRLGACAILLAPHRA
ncbi:hypothetical protein ACTGUQ_12255, partial [Streptococcus suis]